MKENMNITLTLSEEASAQIAKEGFDPLYGARPLRRVLQTKVEDKMAEQILSGEIREGDCVQIQWKDGSFTVQKGPLHGEE